MRCATKTCLDVRCPVACSWLNGRCRYCIILHIVELVIVLASRVCPSMSRRWETGQRILRVAAGGRFRSGSRVFSVAAVKCAYVRGLRGRRLGRIINLLTEWPPRRLACRKRGGGEVEILEEQGLPGSVKTLGRVYPPEAVNFSLSPPSPPRHARASLAVMIGRLCQAAYISRLLRAPLPAGDRASWLSTCHSTRRYVLQRHGGVRVGQRHACSGESR
jgi:hypothetical protein